MPVFGGALGYSLAPWIRRRPTLYKWLKPVAQWYAGQCGYRQIGLKYDDLIPEESEVVQKALGRLTPAQSYDRAFRLRVAQQCSVLHRDLPKSQWLKPEEDDRYLSPIIAEIEREEAERKMLDSAKVVKREH